MRDAPGVPAIAPGGVGNLPVPEIPLALTPATHDVARSEGHGQGPL